MTAMWEQRTASMLDALDGSGVSVNSETLLDDLIEAGLEHPKVERFLVSLPGYPNDPATALTQLEYLTRTAQAGGVSQA